jgi:hypothetical protein
MAVFNAVQKNKIIKYKMYLQKLWNLSKKQVLVTIIYVPAVKGWNSLKIGLAGILFALKLPFGK